MRAAIALAVLAAAAGLVSVAQETLDDQQKHLDQTQGFVDIGTPPEIALAQSKTGVANARSIRGEYAPSLNVNAGWTDAGRHAGNLTWNFSTGVALGIPISTGGLTDAQLREAQANLASLRAQRDVERLQARAQLLKALGRG